MNNTGIFKDFSVEERSRTGIFGSNLIKAVEEISYLKFSPRAVIMSKNLTTEACVEKWKRLITSAFFDLSFEKYSYTTPKDIKRIKPEVYRRWRFPFYSKVIEKTKVILIEFYNFLRKIYVLRVIKRAFFKVFKIHVNE